MTMGDRIKQLRETYGMTQEQLGEILGVQKSAIRKYEKGAVENIKRSSIKKMADTFGVSPAYLMGWDDDDSNSSSKQTFNHQEQVLLDKFRKLNTNGKLKAIESVSDLTEINKYVNHVYIVKEAGRDGSFKDVTVTDEDVEGYYKLEIPSDEI